MQAGVGFHGEVGSGRVGGGGSGSGGSVGSGSVALEQTGRAQALLAEQRAEQGKRHLQRRGLAIRRGLGRRRGRAGGRASVVVVVGGQHIQMHGGLQQAAAFTATTLISNWNQHGEVHGR